ncbi:MAG: leucine-rich repeat domain-containing protein [Spirochaetaceae bacterium]|nr:leucine-rich repeat domain-containing protein [Spirochaetaceae bacterium]
MKRICAFFLYAALTSSILSAQSIEDFEYRTEIHNGSIGIAITGYNGKERDIEIPALIRGFPVTVIDDGAFKNKALLGVIIPSSVRKIGKESFTGNKFNDVIVPKNLTEIESDSFDNNLLVNVPELSAKLPQNRRPSAKAAAAPAKREGVFAGSGGNAAAPQPQPVKSKQPPAMPEQKQTVTPPSEDIDLYFDDEWENCGETTEITVTNLETADTEPVQERIRYRKENGQWVAERESIDEPLSTFDYPEISRSPPAAPSYPYPPLRAESQTPQKYPSLPPALPPPLPSTPPPTAALPTLPPAMPPPPIQPAHPPVTRAMPPQASPPAARQMERQSPKPAVKTETKTFAAGEWQVHLDGGFISIAGYSGKNKILVIPYGIEGRRVNGIAPGAFAGKALQSVSFPASVTVIGEKAFASNCLGDIVIPPAVRLIGAAAFDDNPVYRIKISSGVALNADSFPAGFAAFYNEGGQRAGTYALGENGWTAVSFDKLAYDSM